MRITKPFFTSVINCSVNGTQFTISCSTASEWLIRRNMCTLAENYTIYMCGFIPYTR